MVGCREGFIHISIASYSPVRGARFFAASLPGVALWLIPSYGMLQAFGPTGWDQRARGELRGFWSPARGVGEVGDASVARADAEGTVR